MRFKFHVNTYTRLELTDVAFAKFSLNFWQCWPICQLPTTHFCPVTVSSMISIVHIRAPFNSLIPLPFCEGDQTGQFPAVITLPRFVNRSFPTLPIHFQFLHSCFQYCVLVWCKIHWNFRFSLFHQLPFFVQVLKRSYRCAAPKVQMLCTVPICDIRNRSYIRFHILY